MLLNLLQNRLGGVGSQGRISPVHNMLEVLLASASRDVPYLWAELWKANREQKSVFSYEAMCELAGSGARIESLAHLLLL